jgi:Alpha-glucosidases, family 31 of glycosyl hydrolases
VQDWQYWGGEFPVKWNALEFGNPAFAEPAVALEKLHAMNLRCIISIWPNFGPETAAAEKFREIGALLPISSGWPAGAQTYDAYNPAARDLYWKMLDEGIRRHGVDGWWMDASEPEMGFVGTQEMWPKFDQHDIPTHAGPFRAVRNAFPLAHTENVAQKQKAADPSRRPFILTRSAFAGQQRSGAQVWSGDVTSTWKSFRAQIPAALNFSACGIPLWNSDIGGFFADKEFPGGIAQDGFRELYVRWAQFAAFTPMMRSHGTFSPREIWHFGEPGTKHYDAIAKAIRLRYALLPYIYSTAYAVHAKGDSFMRGLFMEDPSDARLRDIADEFMFGRSLLAAPITQPGATAREVILPKGKWRRFAADPAASKKVFENKTTAAAPLDEIPVFVKAGAIVPYFPGLVSYSSERPWTPLEIRVFPGADGAFNLYEDEFDGHGYEKGAASLIRFEWDDAARRLTIHARKGSFPGMLRSRLFRVIHPDGAPAEIRYAGREISLELPINY